MAPIVEEIHEVRRKMLARVGGDLGKLVAWLKTREAEHPERMISAEEFRKLKEQSETKTAKG